MRYSRMLEESSFTNKKADYFWLLALSSIMLLVRLYLLPTRQNVFSYWLIGSFTAVQSPISLLLPCVRSNLSMVKASPIHADIIVRSIHNNSSISPFGSGRILLAAQWDMESCCGWPCRLCGWSRRLVHERCMDTGDGWRSNNIERAPRQTVSCSWSFNLDLFMDYLHQETPLWWHMTLIVYKGCTNIIWRIAI